MATATKKPRPARAPKGGRSTPSEFRVFETNTGDFHWVIASADGSVLAQSGSFASLADAELAAIAVRDGAAGIRIERHGGDTSRGRA